jgi:choline dehydrogenase-like flavoprotein
MSDAAFSQSFSRILAALHGEPPAAVSGPVAHALAEAFFPQGQRLPACDAAALVATVAGYCAHVPGLPAGLAAGLGALEWGYWLQHGQRFSQASLAERQRGLEALSRSEWAGPLLRALSVPYRAAYALEDVNQRRLNLHAGLRVPATRERQRWQQQVTPVDALEPVNEIEAEVVVIGTGAGGAAAAHALASRGCAVVILEEGHYHEREAFTGRLTEMIPRLYRASGATVALGNAVIPVPVGRSVGGTTTINSGTCLRTPADILRRWRTEGLRELTDEAMDPWFTHVESVLRVQRAEVRFVGELARVVGDGAAALGFHDAHPLMRNAEGCDGQGLCQFGCPTDAKQSTNVSFIPRALQAGAFLYTGVKAGELLRSGQQVQGVVAEGVGADGIRRRLTVRAPQVVVAAGTFFTPLFLQQNGVRSSWLGRNLSLHPAGAVTGYFPDREFDNSNRIPQGFGVADLAEEGILFEGGTPPFAAHGLLNPYAGRDFVEYAERYQNTAWFGFMIRDESRGRVSKGLHPDVPLIRYSMNDRDFARFRKGLHTLAAMLLEGGAAHVEFPGFRRFPRVRSRRELDTVLDHSIRPRHFAISAYHPLGTARLGADPSRGVCDQDHRVHGWEGLYVMDGAAVPSSLGANPQVTIMALASRAADRLAQRINP